MFISNIIKLKIYDFRGFELGTSNSWIQALANVAIYTYWFDSLILKRCYRSIIRTGRMHTCKKH